MSKAIVTGGILISLAFVVSCAGGVPPIATPRPAPTPSPTVAPTATLGPKAKIKTAYSQVSPDALPIWVSQDLGFFSDNNLEVELVFIDGGTKLAQSLVAKEVVIGATGASSTVGATATGGALVLIAGLVNSPNYDFIVRPFIKSGADLIGKKVAVSGATGSSATAMRIALRDIFKIDPDKDVTTVIIGNEADREAAMVAGQIDATVVNPDLSIKAKKDGMVVLESLWNRDIPYQQTAVATSQAYLKDNPAVITNYLKGLIQGIGYIRNPVNKANVIRIMGKYLKTDDQDSLSSAYTRMSQAILQCAPYVSLDGTKAIINETKAAVDKGLTLADTVDISFVRSLDESGFVKANCK